MSGKLTEARDATSPAPAEALERPDATPFQVLYERHFGQVFNYVRYRVHDSSGADDITAQAFLKAFSRFRTYDSRRASFSTWLIAIARNTVNDHLRARRRWRWLPLDVLLPSRNAEPGPEERLEQSESRHRLLAALRALPERDRDVLALKFAGQQTHVAIAQFVGLSESHVSVVVYRAVRKLREQLAEPQEARHA
jgi:RNA polymerase sigma factor (sigma-70 family)